MYTLDEMNSRLDYLSSISPGYGTRLIEELREAIQAYLARDSDFELQVNKTLDKVIADSFHNGLEYEKMELLEPWQSHSSDDAPEGYDDVSDLFKGSEVFEEIMAVTDREFIAAFYAVTNNEGDGDSGGSSETEYHNTYVDDWIARLQAALDNELEGLKEIMRYCANRSYSAEWAILFEELGKNTKRHPVRYYAKEIFLTKGYGWLIETFNLNVYRPSYMAELPDWTDEDNTSQN